MPSATTSPAVRTPDGEGIKDTIESIVIALILAFVFRAFVVEAFVIPTGSMAPTLYGAHGTIICDDCGVEFAYGLRDLAETRKVPRVHASARVVCPNCNHPNTGLETNDDARNTEKGDRILVLKWPFDIGGDWLGPARWDVTVFKDPADGVTNFIKRLVGLPNEVLMIVDGDVFRVPTAELSAEAVRGLDRLRHEKYELRTGIKRGRLRAVPPVIMNELDKKMTVVRKTPAAQQLLWSKVYDHDFPPRERDVRQPIWLPARGSTSGWDASGRTIRFEDKGLVADHIELAGKEIRATCSYNISRGRVPPVSDLQLKFVLTPDDSQGVIRMRLEKLKRVFWATIRMDGLVTLTESDDVPSDSDTVMASTRLSPFRPGEAVQMSFENLDYRLSVNVGGKEVLVSSGDPDSPAFYGANLKSLRRTRAKRSVPPRIYAEGGSFRIAHLVVKRDIYYFHDPTYRALALSWAPRAGWASPQSPILLRQHEYFVLGDNTAASKDSRLWDKPGKHLQARGEEFQLGTVPRDQLVGKAFFVYWPSGYRLSWLPIPGLNRLGVIPDVGRMRWIR